MASRSYYWRLCIIYSFLLASILPLLSAKKSCVKPEKCQLTSENGQLTLSVRGPIGYKGDKGSIGPIGLKGLQGQKGDAVGILTGERGERGLPGLKGWSGPPGTQGEKGFEGLPGKAGQRGDSGSKGDSAFEASSGLTSPPGPIGAPGDSGSDGYCSCRLNESDDDLGLNTLTVGDNLGEAVCKDVPRRIETGQYIIGPGDGINVICKTRPGLTTLTCLPPTGKKSTDYTFSRESKWLREKFENVYGVTRAELSWIKSRSNYAYQTIRYHCTNSVPFPRNDVEKSLLLLGWNDVVFGPLPTSTSPFYYHVPSQTDKCAIEDTFTDIKITSEASARIPVVDFRIGNSTRNHVSSTTVSIENIELCFD